VGEARYHRRRGKNRRLRVGNRPILVINWPGCDGRLAMKTVSEVRPEITGKSVKISDFYFLNAISRC
jgi:uncharacterized protein YlaI